MKPGIKDQGHTPASLASSIDEEVDQCARFGIDRNHFERALFAGAREFLLRPGKAFRARLVEASFTLSGGEAHRLPRASLEAIELLHGGSLIVDDIQDDADERRGAPALHRIMGVPRALNVGNWLYFMALAKLDELELEVPRTLELTRAAHRCFLRCHEGQALDLSLRVSELKRAEVASVAHTTSQLKTGALMSFAARLGGIAARADALEVETLARFGERAGIALQMLDDLGSFVATSRQKKGFEDLRGQRVTWVWAWGAEVLDDVSYRQLARQTSRAENLDEVLSRLARAVESIGRERIQLALRGALRGLTQVFGKNSTLDQLSAELKRLEMSYG